MNLSKEDQQKKAELEATHCKPLVAELAKRLKKAGHKVKVEDDEIRTADGHQIGLRCFADQNWYRLSGRVTLQYQGVRRVTRTVTPPLDHDKVWASLSRDIENLTAQRAQREVVWAESDRCRRVVGAVEVEAELDEYADLTTQDGETFTLELRRLSRAQVVAAGRAVAKAKGAGP